jgi:hypothetical protein
MAIVDADKSMQKKLAKQLLLFFWGWVTYFVHDCTFVNVQTGISLDNEIYPMHF